MSTGGNRAYRLYSSLKEPDAIRLLRLLPSPSSSSPLQCEFYTTTLSAYEDEIIDHYTAISYVWGDADDTRHILVNGFTLRVTANLETALRDLRAETSIRILWIDAICINQQDLTERASQVGLMGKIYSLALYTVIYLGPIDGPPKDALSDLGNVPRDLATPVGTPARSHKVTSKHGDVKSSLLPISSLSRSQHWQQMAKAERSSVSNNKGTFAKILERPWFTRVWVFQELIFSRDPWLQVGSFYRIRWSDFCKLPAIDFGLHLDLSPAILKGCLLLQGMNNARMRHAANYKPPLLELLEGRRGLGFSDPRDMLFAHVDISLEGRSDPRLQVDYRKTTEEVYTGITTYFLEQPSIGYKILSFVGDSSVPGGFPGRPSWVPDWTVPGTGLKCIHQDYGSPSFPSGQSSFFQDSEIIAARGRSLGRIKAMGKPMIIPPLAFFDRSQEVK